MFQNGWEQFMKKNLFIIGFPIIFITMLACGCQEQKAVEAFYLEGVEFDSNIVELIYYNITKNTNQGKVLSIDVKYLFKNIANKDLELKLYVEFYDQDNKLIYTGCPKYIDLQNNWTEQGLSPANTISYSGKQTNEVNFVKFLVSER